VYILRLGTWYFFFLHCNFIKCLGIINNFGWFVLSVTRVYTFITCTIYVCLCVNFSNTRWTYYYIVRGRKTVLDGNRVIENINYHVTSYLNSEANVVSASSCLAAHHWTKRISRMKLICLQWLMVFDVLIDIKSAAVM